jgi:glyoxylase-like metal-dependent hydrolase (beta-lactamase superfamily II)
MKIIPLSEGTFTIDHTKLFIPFDEQTQTMDERTSGSLLLEVQPFLIITNNDILLLDAGLGFQRNGAMQIHQNIIEAGFKPSDVTKVLLTHLHKDHSGGVGTERDGLGGRLAFPNAMYYLQRKELAFAFEKAAPSYLTDELVCLQNSSQVILLDGNGSINEQIEFEITGAHSPYHQVYWIKENNETIFFGGDDASQLQQMKHKFVAKYDFDGKKAMELRQQWWQQGEKEKWTFLFYHDVKNPIWKF